MAEKNAFNLPNGEPIRSAWSRVIRNQKVALRKLLDNARFVNASIVSDAVTGAMRIWRKDFGAHADELAGRMIPYMMAVLTRSGNAIRVRQGFTKAEDWFIRDSARVAVLEKTVLDLCHDTLTSIAIDAGDKVEQVRAKLIAGEIDTGNGGWTDLYTSLDDFFEEGSQWRSARIARTEGSRAANWGIREAAEDMDDCIGFEWLMAPGACQACQTAGKTVNGLPKKVAKGNPFVKNLGPKITNKGDALRERVIPEEYRQIYFGPLHPHDRCSVKPIFKPLDGSTVEFDKPLDMADRYIPNSEEIDPVNPAASGVNSGLNPPKNTRSTRIPLVRSSSKSVVQIKSFDLKHWEKPCTWNTKQSGQK